MACFIENAMYNGHWNFVLHFIACIIISHQFIRIISTIPLKSIVYYSIKCRMYAYRDDCFVYVTLFSIGCCLLNKNNRWRINDPFCYETISKTLSFDLVCVLNICRYHVQCVLIYQAPALVQHSISSVCVFLSIAFRCCCSAAARVSHSPSLIRCN